MNYLLVDLTFIVCFESNYRKCDSQAIAQR
jgi:hypothetical protein